MKLRASGGGVGRELAAEIATDVLIIEDDTFIAMELETLVEGLGHRVLGVARTHAEALALTKRKRPGLILADIQLADGSSGLEAVNELLASFEAPVIFITAYPERFLTGERPEPAFLIAKPFQPATVSAVASQALVLRAQRQEARATRPRLRSVNSRSRRGSWSSAARPSEVSAERWRLKLCFKMPLVYARRPPSPSGEGLELALQVRGPRQR